MQQVINVFRMSMSERRYYIKKSLVPYEEDEYHEFKGHRSISIEDLPPWCFQPGTDRRSRKSVSRALAAFLNSGRGGTLYMGIVDEGVVKGLYMTEFQKDHVTVAIKDLFSRYQPPVTEDKFKFDFVPVFDETDSKKEILYPEEQDIDKETAERHLKPHLLRTYDFCWCDRHLSKCIDDDVKQNYYVIEVVIYPQHGNFRYFHDGSFEAVLPIVYLNEEEKCFFRKSASCVEYSLEAVKNLALQQLKDLYEPLITSLRQELEEATRNCLQ